MIAQLQAERKGVCYIGDGINDAIADVSVSLSGASTVATDTAQVILMDERVDQLEETHEQGHSLVFIAVNDQLTGAIEFYPTIRLEAKQTITQLKQRGLSIYIISDDHEQPTQKLAQKLGIENYFAETLPEDKANLIEQLQKEGKVVCFVGDGINDSIALKKSQVSISFRGASTIATDTAAIVLMDSHLSQLEQLFGIAESFNANMKNNLNLSIIPTFICKGIYTNIKNNYNSMTYKKFYNSVTACFFKEF